MKFEREKQNVTGWARPCWPHAAITERASRRVTREPAEAESANAVTSAMVMH